STLTAQSVIALELHPTPIYQFLYSRQRLQGFKSQ
ncbi:MAG: hypothetical protein ACI9US_003226, partial [Gammaproteobacteria bacterium]